MYDYAPGKADWLAWGLPREGASATVPTAGSVARRDVPTCARGDEVGAVRERARAAGWEECVVVNDRRIVLGLLRREDLAGGPGLPVEDAMRPGPTTYKLDVAAAEAAERMRARGVRAVLVATPDGALVGMLRREDAEAAGEGGA